MADVSEYFKNAMDFLTDFSWIFKHSNTQFIKNGVLEHFPAEWINFFCTIPNEELNAFPKHNTQIENIPETLRLFINRLDKLKIKTLPFDFQGNEIYFKKMKPKKMHEISRLSLLITDLCQDKVDILIDFGSGLGYLSEILHQNCNCKIIGLESDERRVINSNERQQKLYPKSKGKVKYLSHMITEDSENFITKCIQTEFESINLPKLAIIGLHSCADLTVTSMNLFLKMNNVTKLIIMPCCYHKMQLAEHNESKQFTNFPLSMSLLNVIQDVDQYRQVLNRPFLRLACQQTVSTWSEISANDHNRHGNDMFLRGVVESIIGDGNFVVKKKNTESPNFDPNCSFDDMCSQYTLKSQIDGGEVLLWNEDHKVLYDKIFYKYPLGEKIAEGLTCLQASMQELCENLVLFDRVCYMEECAQKNNLKITVKFQKIMNEKISPRCHVLIAEKI